MNKYIFEHYNNAGEIQTIEGGIILADSAKEARKQWTSKFASYCELIQLYNAYE